VKTAMFPVATNAEQFNGSVHGFLIRQIVQNLALVPGRECLATFLEKEKPVLN
jgi:hypothetical protein